MPKISSSVRPEARDVVVQLSKRVAHHNHLNSRIEYYQLSVKLDSAEVHVTDEEIRNYAHNLACQSHKNEKFSEIADVCRRFRSTGNAAVWIVALNGAVEFETVLNEIEIVLNNKPSEFAKIGNCGVNFDTITTDCVWIDRTVTTSDRSGIVDLNSLQNEIDRLTRKLSTLQRTLLAPLAVASDVLSLQPEDLLDGDRDDAGGEQAVAREETARVAGAREVAQQAVAWADSGRRQVSSVVGLPDMAKFGIQLGLGLGFGIALGLGCGFPALFRLNSFLTKTKNVLNPKNW